MDMKDTYKGIIMASPLALKLTKGWNTTSVGGAWNGNVTKAADLDKIIMYPLESAAAECSCQSKGSSDHSNKCFQNQIQSQKNKC